MISLSAWSQFSRSPVTSILFPVLIVKILHIPVSWFAHRRLSSIVYPRRAYQGVRRWGAFTLLLLTAIAMARPWLPLIRFHANREALESAIAAGDVPPFSRIGSLDIEYVRFEDRWGGVLVQTEHDGHDHRYGFLFVSGDAPRRDEIAPGWRLYP